MSRAPNQRSSSMKPEVVFLPGLLCDAAVFAHQVAALEPFALSLIHI